MIQYMISIYIYTYKYKYKYKYKYTYTYTYTYTYAYAYTYTYSYIYIYTHWGHWGFHKWKIPKIDALEWKIPLKLDDFRGIPILGNPHMSCQVVFSQTQRSQEMAQESLSKVVPTWPLLGRMYSRSLSH